MMNSMVLSNIIITTCLTLVFLFAVSQVRKSDISSPMNLHLLIMSATILASFTYGVLFGILYGHNIILATIICALIGMVVGGVFGRLLHVFLLLASSAEGLMSGMMGAMTGVMVAMMEGSILIAWFLNIVLALFLSIVFGYTAIVRNKNKSAIRNHSFN